MEGGADRHERTGGGGNPAAGARSGDRPAEGVGKLGAGREFDLIRSFFPDGVDRRPDVLVGAGDDAAVVRGDGIVLSSDLSVEGVHFRREWLTPRQIGYRAATASLSDLAAMAARPIGVLASLALPAADAGEFAAEVMAGVREAAGRVGATVLGGDVTRAPDVLVLDVVAVGEAESPVLRSGAKPGDEVWVTGRLGAAAWAIEGLLTGRIRDAREMEPFLTPVARTAEALWLVGRKVPQAMLDLSDGIAGDAEHLARASGVGVVLEEASLPIHERLVEALEPEGVLRLALSGGEDYELLFVARPGAVSQVVDAFGAEFGIALTRVGQVGEGEGVHLRGRSGGLTRLVGRGYQHFQGP